MQKELWKQPDTYFVLVPILACLWALGAGAVLHPKSIKAWDSQKAEYAEAENLIEQILLLDPERLTFKEQKGKSSEFAYHNEVARFAAEYGITPGNYDLSVRTSLKLKGKKRKSADLSIKSIKIEKLAGFISAMLFRWPDLECEQLTLDKVGAAKDDWKVKLRFTYYY